MWCDALSFSDPHQQSLITLNRLFLLPHTCVRVRLALLWWVCGLNTMLNHKGASCIPVFSQGLAGHTRTLQTEDTTHPRCVLNLFTVITGRCCS